MPCNEMDSTTKSYKSIIFLIKYFKRIVPSCQIYYSIMVLTGRNIIQ